MNSDILLKYFARISDAPDAPSRLRKFVLELAVRGKLVQQNPDDEPATELLNRIAVERVRLGRTDNQRRRNNTSRVARVEGALDLPHGWACVPLSDLVTVLNGRAYAKNELLDQGVPVLRVGNLFTSRHWYHSDLKLDEDKYCDEGDLIFAWSASFGPFIWPGPKVIFHYHIWKLALHSDRDLDKNYLYRFLLHKTEEIRNSGHGVSMLHMTKEKMEELQVPIPPLGEQHRIVAKVDELMSLCDRLEAAQAEREIRRDRLAAASLHRLNQPNDTDTPDAFREHARFYLNLLPRITTRPDQIKQLRHTILNLAIRGKLVPQNPAEGSAPAFGLGPDVVRENRLGLAIPNGWSWVRVENVAEARLGKMLDGAKNSGHPFRYLRNTNIHWFEVRMDELKEIRLEPTEVETYRLRVGDVLICEGGHGIGRTAVWRTAGEDIVFQKALHRVRPGPALDCDFFSYCMAVYSQARVLEGYFTGVGIPHFTGRALSALVFPLPPKAEQCRIVSKVSELMSLCDRLDEQLAMDQVESHRLLELILKDTLANDIAARMDFSGQNRVH